MRQYIVASVLIIISLICIAIGESSVAPTWLQPYISEFSSALLVGGLLALLFKIVQEKEQDSKLRKLFRIHDSVDDLGVVQILPEVQGYNFTNIIEESSSLSIVMNDGLRWVGNNTNSLSKRFSSKNKTTEIFTVDPESNFVDVLAHKVEYKPEALREKIEKSWKDIENAFNQSKQLSGYAIYGIRTFPTKSIFLADKELVETPYQISSGKAKIPLYIYRKTTRTDSPYAFAEHDIEQLRIESRKIKEVSANEKG